MYRYVISPGEHFVFFNASFTSSIVTGSGGTSSCFSFDLNLLPGFYCCPTSISSSFDNNFLNGLIAASLHTSLMSDPEYPWSFLPTSAYSKFSALSGGRCILTIAYRAYSQGKSTKIYVMKQGILFFTVF